MLYFWSFRWLLLHLLFGQCHIQYTIATWPLLNSSSLRLLGLFLNIPDGSNSSTTPFSVHSRAMFKAAIVISQKYNFTLEGQYLGWITKETGGNVIGALNSTCLALPAATILGIIGPTFSRQAHVIADLGKTIGIPVISYSATDPDLSYRSTYPAFYRTVPSDNSAVLSMVKLFSRFNWTSCIVIYQSDDFGSGGADAVSEIFNDNNLTVTDTLVFDTATVAFRGDLKTTLSRSSSRIVLLWAEPTYTTFILQNALNNDVLGPQFTWILCSSVSLRSFNQTFYQKLIGMLTIEPAVGNTVDAPINTTLLNAAYDIWKQYEPESFPGATMVDKYALFAFDATWSLIQSLQQLCSTTTTNFSSCLPVRNTSLCFDRRFLNSNAYFNTIIATEFLGVSGPIKFNVNVTDRTNGTYYILRNVQPSSNKIDYVSVLKWSDLGDWNSYLQSEVIVWPGNTLDIPTGLPNLSGVYLRIGIIKIAPFTMIKTIVDTSGQNITKFIGYVPDLIDRLKTEMNFIPNIILVPSNQTYNGLIQAVANGVYDIVVGDVTVTSRRRKIVDFSSSIFDNSMRIIIRQSTSVNVDLFSYLKPFSMGLWLTLLGTCIYAAFLIFLIEREKNEALKHKSIISSNSMSLWFSFGNIMGYGGDFHVKTAAGRLITAGLYILSIILVATYTANLASNLTLSKSKDIISGIDDIKNGKISFNRIGIVVGSALEDYYLREISGGSRNFYPLKSGTEIYDDLLNNIIDASIFDTGLLEYATSTLYCNLTLIGADFGPSAYGIVMPKQWIYAQALDVAILSLREASVLDDLKRQWFEGKTCSDSSADLHTSITITEMAGLFLTFAIISILSLLLFAWTTRFLIKKYLWKTTRRKNSLIQQDNFAKRSSVKTDDQRTNYF